MTKTHFLIKTTRLFQNKTGNSKPQEMKRIPSYQWWNYYKMFQCFPTRVWHERKTTTEWTWWRISMFFMKLTKTPSVTLSLSWRYYLLNYKLLMSCLCSHRDTNPLLSQSHHLHHDWTHRSLQVVLIGQRWRAQWPAAGRAVAVGVWVVPVSVLLLVLALVLVLVLVFVLVLLLLLLVLVVVVVMVAVLAAMFGGGGGGVFGEGGYRCGGHGEHGLLHWRRLFTWTERGWTCKHVCVCVLILW